MKRTSTNVLSLFLLAAICLMAAPAEAKYRAKPPIEWQGRRIYQILTDRFAGGTGPCNASIMDYCGGTFAGLESKLDYIGGMGFNAIWISPIIVNTPGGYHGYWAKDFFAVNPHFGTAAQLQSLMDAAHAKDIWIMIDVVVNHVGPVGEDYSGINPFNETSHYHKLCYVSNYTCNTEMIYHCRLYNLPDLDQDNPYVNQQLFKYIEWLLGTFGFDGIRMDTVMYIKPSYWAELGAKEPSFIVGEISSTFACNKEYTQWAIDATLNYPLYYALRNVFQQGQSMQQLGSAWRQQLTLEHPDWEVNFIDNADVDRFMTDPYVPESFYMSGIAHMYFTNGIPCIYYGTEQLLSGTIKNNECRQAMWATKSGFDTSSQMYKFIATLNDLYEQVDASNHIVEEVWSDDKMYCFYRGLLLLCTSNSGFEQTRTIQNLPFAGMKVVNWLDKTQTFTGAQTMTVTIPKGLSPLILVGQEQ